MAGVIFSGAGQRIQTPFRSIDLDETEEEVVGKPAYLAGALIQNLHATDNRFVRFYDAAAADVTVGTTTPYLGAIRVAAGETLQIDFRDAGGRGTPFPTAISVAATTGVADSDTGAPGANEVLATVFFTLP